MCSVLNSKPSRERRKKYRDDDENKSRAGCNVMDIKRCVQFAIYFRFVISDDDSQRREHFSHQFYSKRRLSSPRFHIFQVSEVQRKIKNRRGNRLENNIERLSLQVHLWSSCIVILLLDISVAVEYDARAREISCNYQQTLFFCASLPNASCHWKLWYFAEIFILFSKVCLRKFGLLNAQRM